jgi:hypothetical protein
VDKPSIFAFGENLGRLATDVPAGTYGPHHPLLSLPAVHHAKQTYDAWAARLEVNPPTYRDSLNLRSAKERAFLVGTLGENIDRLCGIVDRDFGRIKEAPVATVSTGLGGLGEGHVQALVRSFVPPGGRHDVGGHPRLLPHTNH